MKKRSLTAFFIILCVVTCAFVFAACSDVPKAHTHDYKWHSDASSHWQTCEVPGCDAPQTEKNPHSFGEWHTVETGSDTPDAETRTCSVCKYEESRKIPTPAHKHVMTHTDGQPADCTNDGNIEYWQCSECGKYFADYGGDEEIDYSDTVINATGHDFSGKVADKKYLVSEATCQSKALYHLSCTRCEKAGTGTFEVGEKAAHTPGEPTHINETSPTCSSDGGYDEIVLCKDCDAEISRKHVTQPATDHTYDLKYDKNLTSHWRTCTVCGHKDAVVNHVMSSGECTVCRMKEPTPGLEYTLDAGGEHYACSGIGTATATDIVIAIEHDGKPVTSVSAYAFIDCETVTSVYIPDTVTSIDQSAFENCVALEKAELPIGLTYLGGSAFEGCIKLERITVPDGITDIYNSTFKGCTSLASVRLNKGVKNIMRDAFRDCSALNDISFVDTNVVSIAECAFASTAITSLDLPATLAELGEGAFEGCDALESIAVDPNNKNYLSAGNCIIDKTEKTVVVGCKASIIPNDGSAVGINKNAFSYCTSLKNLIVPSAIRRISDNAFEGCTNLDSITLPFIGTSAGNSATGLFYTIFGGDYAKVPESLKRVVLTDITAIGDNAFAGCSGLEDVTLPDGLKTIGNSAFSNCASLSEINIPDGVTGIGDDAFAYTALINVRVPDSVTTLGIGMFNHCALLVSASLPSGINTIGEYAFAFCESLSQITIPRGVSTIDGFAFYGCISLTELTLPDTVTMLGHSVFDECPALTLYCESARLPQYSGNWNSKLPVVYNCKDNDADGNGVRYTVNGGVRYSLKNGIATVIRQPASVVSAQIQSVINYKGVEYRVTGIDKNAFEKCKKLTSVTIPDSVTLIDESAFSYCSALVSVSFGNGVSEIGDRAFYNCESLVDITLPEGLRTIERGLFELCGSLKNVTIPNSVTTIENTAFSRCDALTHLTIPSGVTTVGSSAFACKALTYNEYEGSNYLGNDENPYLVFIAPKDKTLTSYTLNESTRIIYSMAFNDCTSVTNITLHSGITCIGEYAFRNCTELKSINIPSTVIQVGNTVLYNCRSLESISVDDGNTAYSGAGNCLVEISTKKLIAGCKNSKIPADGSVTEIGRWAFTGCKDILVIAIPKSVTYIDNGAFAECTSLTTINFGGTLKEWNDIRKGAAWNQNTGKNLKVFCTDGNTAVS